MRNTDNRTILDIGMRNDRLFDFRRIHVNAARNNHVLNTIGDEQEPILIEIPNITRAIIAVLYHILAECFLTNIIFKDQRRIDRNLAFLTCRKPVPVLVNNGNVDPVERQPA